MSPIVSPIERSQSQTYNKVSDFKLNLSKTRSCPPNRTKSRRSESSIRSNSSVVPKLPSGLRNGSIGAVTSLSSKDIELNAIESSTSSSVFHGIILVSIMLSSLVAFVCSKMKRPCDLSDDISYEMTSKVHNCLMPVILFFSVITIISCLISFIIYFLHLIGQCDQSWIVNKKFSIEIVIISVIAIMLIIANTLMVLKTRVLDHSIGIFSIVCSSIAVTGYAIRMTKLCSECKRFSKRNDRNSEDNPIDETALMAMKDKLKSKLNVDCSRNWELSDNNMSVANHQTSGSALRVVSYVKRKRSLESTLKSVSQNQSSTAYDLDIEDDVFIN